MCIEFRFAASQEVQTLMDHLCYSEGTGNSNLGFLYEKIKNKKIKEGGNLGK